MRVSNFPLNTLKETPSDAEVISHQLMLRSGMIRKLASGLYTWLPLGYKILRKVENIIREEMNKSGALEVLMPTIQPAEIWQESTRWEQYGPELLRLKDRHEREYVYGPTHEEVITEFARREINSYKQLPVNYYQIQLKFRDEIRPRFGVMRAREFIMKDAYSFHIDHASLDNTYQLMHTTYSNIFTRLGLEFRSVEADSGAIGGNASQEFHVLADSGEDAIAYSTGSDYAANIQLAEAIALEGHESTGKTLSLVETPDVKSIEHVSKFFETAKQRCLKTLLVKGVEDTVVALVLRGDHTLNEIKAEKLEQVEQPLQLLESEEISKRFQCETGSIGPIKLNATIIADRSAVCVNDFICGANQTGKHYSGANWDRDLPKPIVADIRNVEEGDPSPDGQGTLKIVRGIEVGHIFQLGDKYSKSMQADVLDKNGKSIYMQMGCYGIGVTRVVAAAIEQNHDDRGIRWPLPIAPFDMALIPINAHKSTEVKETTERLYQELTAKGYDVLLDDRDVRPGVKFADMELIGIPHRFVISEKSLEKKIVEYKSRDGSVEKDIDLEQLEAYIDKLITP